MAKILNLQAPKSMSLHKMRAEEVEQHVSRLADEALDKGLDGLRPVGVNAIALGQRVPGTAAEPGVWAEWTRACCNRRESIEEFVDPAVEQFEREGSPVARELAGEHLESQMRIQTLEHPTQHRRA
jgi:hypothetical protein